MVPLYLGAVNKSQAEKTKCPGCIQSSPSVLFSKPLVETSLYYFALKSSQHLFVSLSGCKTTLRTTFFHLSSPSLYLCAWRDTAAEIIMDTRELNLRRDEYLFLKKILHILFFFTLPLYNLSFRS